MRLLIPELLRNVDWLPTIVGQLPQMNVAQVNCGNGERCRLWAAGGHRVFGTDHDPAQIALARASARAAQLEILFDLASASALPWPERSMDLCLAPPLPGLGSSWLICLSELGRVLKPGGLLCLGEGPRLRTFRRHLGGGITVA